MRDYPRLLDNRRTPLDPAVSVDYGLEAFDSEESNALEFSTALAPVVPPSADGEHITRSRGTSRRAHEHCYGRASGFGVDARGDERTGLGTFGRGAGGQIEGRRTKN